MTIDNQRTEIVPVSAEQVAIALSLLRAAVLDGPAQEAFLPLSDRGIGMALLEPDALKRGIGVLSMHFEFSDGIHPVVLRVLCFLKLLREQSHNPDPLWNNIATYHDRFVSIAKAIAWCPAHKDEAFDVVLFAKIASHMDDAADFACCEWNNAK
jgi:hypothetical protein